MDAFTERPIAWQVAAIDARNDYISGFKKQPHTERFTDSGAADLRKQYLQGTGMVASVTPIFPPKAQRTASLKRRRPTR